VTIWVSGEHAQALAEAARLYDTDVEHVVQRILRENIGHLLTRARQEHQQLLAALRGSGPPRPPDNIKEADEDREP
jgi:hypothetical protein